MEFIDKKINDALNKELEATEGSLTRVKRAIYGDSKGRIRTFAIISPDNPMGKKATPQENNKARKEFKDTLRAGYYQYTPIKGQYNDPEQSYFIFNISFKGAEYLAKTFKQESFIFGQQLNNESKIFYYQTDRDSYEKEGKIDYNQSCLSKGVNLMDTAKDMFSKKNGFKYSFDFDFDNMEFLPSSNQQAFEQSLDDRYSGKSQYYARIKSQRS